MGGIQTDRRTDGQTGWVLLPTTISYMESTSPNDQNMSTAKAISMMKPMEVERERENKFRLSYWPATRWRWRRAL